MPPRTVDMDTRRRDIADATWRVIIRDGLDRASVRGVATEAGLSMGSLRHYFRTQSELHTFAMRLVMDGIRSRVEAFELPTDPRRAAEKILAEFLPLDDKTRAESEVWLAFTARSLVDPALRALREESYDLVHDVCRHLVEMVLAADGQSARDLVTLEVERLYALVDGLLVHGVIRPGRANSALLRRVLVRHLEAL